MPTIRFDSHPQMNFRYMDGHTHGRIAKPDAQGPAPRVENLRPKTVENLAALHAVAQKPRLEQGIRAPNQALDLVQDPSLLERTKYAEFDVANGRENAIAFAGATKMVRSGPCLSMNTLATLEALASGIEGRKRVGVNPAGHATGIHGDERMEPLIEIDAWGLIPKARILPPEEIVQLWYPRELNLDPRLVRTVLDARPAPDHHAIAQHERLSWGTVPPEERFGAYMDNSAVNIAFGGKPHIWNRVYGAGDPRTRYYAAGESTPLVLDSFPVHSWWWDIQAPQQALDSMDQVRLWAGGYRREGNDGA